MSQSPVNSIPVSPPHKPLSRPHLITLFLFLAAAAFLRFHQIGQPSLWMDEIWTIEMSMGHGSVHDHLPLNAIQTTIPHPTTLSQAAPGWRIWTHLNGITHPPLYFLTLRLWMDVFGAGPAAVRSLSAVFSLAAVLLFFDLCRLLRAPRVALFAAALMALAGAQIDFAQEARSYPMVLALSLASADLILRIQRHGVTRLRWAALVALVCATALTHYFAAGILAALALYVAITTRGRIRLYILAAFAAAGLLSLVLWGPQALSQFRSLPSFTPTFLLEARPSLHLIYTYRRIVGLPIELLVGESPGEILCQKVPWLILALAIFILVLPILRLRKRRDLLLWILWLAGSIGFVAGLDLLHGTTLVGYSRYTFLATPAIYAVVASFDWPRPPGRPLIRNLLPTTAVLMLIYSDVDRLNNAPRPREDWKQFAQTLDAADRENENALLVFYNPDPWVTPGSWLMNYLYYSQSPAHPWLLLTAAAPPDLQPQLNSFDSILLITLHPRNDIPFLFPQWRPAKILRTDPVALVRLIRQPTP
jgi:hypothetical protein